MKKAFNMFLLLLSFALILTGCMYPEEKLSQNQIAYKDQIQSVQSAVDQYREANGGLLPIKTKGQTTPIYQKYPIDFKKIAPEYMAEPPGNAFESGGVFQYVIVDAETDPKVKIFDLRIAETIRDINLRVKAHGFPPYKEQIAENVYTMDFKKLGFKEEPKALSPYSGQSLPYVVTGNAEVYVDYRVDLYQALENKKNKPEPGKDIRNLLVEDSDFVPAYSLPYTIEPGTNDPIFLVK